MTNINTELSLFDKALKETLFSSFEHPFVIINEYYEIQSIHGNIELFLPPTYYNNNLLEIVNSSLQTEVSSITSRAIKEQKDTKSAIKKINITGRTYYIQLSVKVLLLNGVKTKLFMVIFEEVFFDDLELDTVKNSLDLIVNPHSVAERHITEEKYKAFIENSMSAFLLTKLDGTILEVNNAAIEIFGYSEEELKQNACQNIIDHDDPQFSKLLEAQFKKGRIKGEAIGIRKNGEYFPVEFSSVVFKDFVTGEDRISKVITDISEIRKTERMLEESSKVGRIGGWELDLFHNTLYWSEVTKEIHEVPSDFVPNLETAVNFYKEGYNRKTINRLLKEAVDKGSSFDIELKIVTIKQRECWIRVKGEAEFRNGKCSRLFGIFQDIDKQKIIQEKLEISQQEYKSLYEQNPAAVFSVNLEGEFISANDVFAQKADCTKEEILNSNFNKFIHQDDLVRVSTYFDDAKKGAVSEAEIRIINAKQKEILIALIVLPIIVNNKITGVYGIANDITADKLIRQSIEKAKNDLTKIMSASQDIICTIDREGKFVLLNKAAEHILGFPIDYLKGKSYNEFVYEADIADTEKSMFLIMNGQLASNFENRYIRIDGTMVPLSWSARWDSTDQLMYCVARDVTQKKKAEEEIIKSNERFEYVTQATFDAIWDWDIVNDLIYWGSGFKTLFGYSNINEFVKGNEWKNRIYKDDIKNVIQSLDTFLQGRELNWTYEYKYLKADGTYAYVLDKAIAVRDPAGNAIRMIGAMQDLTKQKQEEHRLKLLESVIINAKDGVIILEDEFSANASKKIIYVNDALCKITGYSKEELIGCSPNIFQGFNTDKKEIERVKKAMNDWQPVEAEVINYRKNGEEFWMNFSIVPIANETGKYTHWIAIERDVTARKTSEEEKEHLLKELTQNNKELKQFSYITSHNMRAPLTNLLAIFDILDLSKITDMETKVLLDAMKTSTYHLNETLNDLIKILIIKENTNQDVEEIYFSDSVRAVTKSIDSLLKNAKASIKSNFSKAEKVNFNKSYLESIFLNLITNSIKYAHPDRRTQMSITTTTINNTIELVFTDNGLGFDNEKVKGKIFGLYQKFHNHPDSKGIGLYLVYSQVTSLGGNIKVSSKENEGTTFTITFLN
ncbi:MAG: PAS domain S-box protein [Bacteroidota bacterium]